MGRSELDSDLVREYGVWSGLVRAGRASASASPVPAGPASSVPPAGPVTLDDIARRQDETNRLLRELIDRLG